MRMPRVTDSQVNENKGNRSGVAEVTSRISTDADGMSGLVDTLTEFSRREDLFLRPGSF
jgi:hypothetical protein